MGQHKDLVGRQCEVPGLALGRKRFFAVDLADVGGVGPAPVGVAGQQNAQFFKTFADRGDGLCQVQVALLGAALRHAVGLCVCGIDAAAGKDIGPGRKAGGHGAAGHQDFDALRAIAQQQHGGG